MALRVVSDFGRPLVCTHGCSLSASSLQISAAIAYPAENLLAGFQDFLNSSTEHGVIVSQPDANSCRSVPPPVEVVRISRLCKPNRPRVPFGRTRKRFVKVVETENFVGPDRLELSVF